MFARDVRRWARFARERTSEISKHKLLRRPTSLCFEISLVLSARAEGPAPAAVADRRTRTSSSFSPLAPLLRF